jgi:hypothetical protein
LVAIRHTGIVAVIIIASHASGCGSAAEVYWPAGTAAFVRDCDAPRVLAEVPVEQRAIVKRRSLAFANNTPVTVLVDPAYGALSRGATRFNNPVRVRMTKEFHQGNEVIVRRQDLVLPPGLNESLAPILPISFLVLIAAATTLWSVEKLALTLKYRREANHDEITIHPSERVGSRSLTPTRRTQITDRNDSECDQWLAWVAAMTARRKVRCMISCRRSAITDL